MSSVEDVAKSFLQEAQHGPSLNNKLARKRNVTIPVSVLTFEIVGRLADLTGKSKSAVLEDLVSAAAEDVAGQFQDAGVMAVPDITELAAACAGHEVD